VYKRAPQKFRDRLMVWTQRFGALPVGIAAIMPPPCPYAPFVVAAGIMKVPRSRFGTSIAIGRGLRYTLEAILAMMLGKHLTRHLNSVYWSTLKGVAAVALFTLAVWVLYRNRGPRINYEYEGMHSPEQPEKAGTRQ
jgi:membrane protein DedA with SNARE-associated domain